MPSGRSSFASRSMMLRKMENSVGARTRPCLTSFERWQLPVVLHLTLLTFMELAEDGEKLVGTAKARQDFPNSITADSIKDLGQVNESCI